MVIVQDKLISDDIFEEQFICNLKACKGACCWKGDYGAPLEEAELEILDAIYEDLKPFLTEAGKKAIEEKGKYVYYKGKHFEEYGTTLLDNEACAYMVFEHGTAKCGIESAYNAGIVNFKKPISCHLYPIRVDHNPDTAFEALNYDRWDICKAACDLGKKEQVSVYQFLKEAIIRKYGEEFYKEVESVGEYLTQKNKGDY